MWANRVKNFVCRQCWMPVLFSIVLLLSGCSSALPLAPVAPDTQAIGHELDELLQQTVKDESGSVSRNAFLYIDAPSVGLQYAGAAGLGRADTQERASLQQQFIVASVAKSMTSVIIYQMAEEGYFGPAGVDAALAQLDILPPDVISRLHTMDGVSYTHQITLRHLLTHTSGLRDVYFDGADNPVSLMPGTVDGTAADSLLGMAVSDEKYGLSALVRCTQAGVPAGCNPQETYLGRHWVAWDEAAWRADPQDGMAGLLNFYLSGMNENALWLPGEGFHYSDTNYILLGLVIEKMTGNSLHQEMRSRIFDPLGMDDTYLVGAAQPPAEDYEHNLAETWVWYEPAVSVGVDFSIDWGGGGVVSTLSDLAVYMRALVDGELFRHDDTLQAMFDVPQDIRGIFYASGLIMFPTGNGPVAYMMGSNGTWVEYYPPLDLVMVGTTNDFDNMPGQFQFHGQVFQILAAHGMPTPMAGFFSTSLLVLMLCLLALLVLYIIWLAGLLLQRHRGAETSLSIRRGRWVMTLAALFNLLMLVLVGADLGSNMFQMLFGLSPALKRLLVGTAIGMGVFGLLMSVSTISMLYRREGSLFERVLLTCINLLTLAYAASLFWLA